MAEQSGFFNANLVNGEYDRVYLAEQFANYFAKFVGNGVFAGKLSELMVTQTVTPSMKIEVLSGAGWINGYWYENLSNLTFTLATADGVLNRIDIVVLQWNKSTRSINVIVKKGTPASNPSAASLQRDSEIYELKLAEVYVKAGATNVTQAYITDKRGDKSVCGFVTGLIKQLDATEFNQQINMILKEIERNNISKVNSIVDRLNALVENESAFGDLALKVDDIANDVAIASQTLGYSKKNMIPYPFTHKSGVSNGITWTDNGDGTVTANGTSTASSHFTLYKGKAFAPGKYFATSTIDLKGNYFIYVRYVEKNTGAEVLTTHYGFDNAPFEIKEEYSSKYDLFIGLTVAGGITVSNLVFKPMLRNAEILDNSWEPYKPSVAEKIQEDTENAGCFYRLNQKTGIKEWLNPPVNLGVEYCTTERYNNKPVYQIVYYAAALPNNSIMTIEARCSYDKIIAIDGFAVGAGEMYTFPMIVNGFTPAAFISNVIQGSGACEVVIRTNEDVSRYKGYIKLKYTK